MRKSYRVIRKVAQGQDGNQGEELIWIGTFPDREEAEVYIERDKERCGVHPGWLRYRILEEIYEEVNDLISRKAAIREYQKVCEGIKCGECPFLIKVNTEKGSHLVTDCKLEAFLRDLPPAQQWISVSEEMPEPRHSVLVWCPERKNVYCAYTVDGKWLIFGSHGDVLYETVDAWMYVPVPERSDNG